MGWGMGNDFKAATQAATPDLARAYALQGQLDSAEQARIDAVRANNAAGIIGLGEKGYSEYQDWKSKQPIKPVQVGGPFRGLAPYRAPNTGVLPDGYNTESMISGYGSGAAPVPTLPEVSGPRQDMQAPDYLFNPSQNVQMPEGFSDGVTPRYQPPAAPASGGWAGIPPVVGADDFTATPMVDGLLSDAKGMFSSGVDNVGQFADFAGNAIMGSPEPSTAVVDALREGVGADVVGDVAGTALDGLGGTAGVSALEGILSGDDAGTIAKDVALDAGQAALLSSLGLTGPLGWGVGALLSALRG